MRRRLRTLIAAAVCLSAGVGAHAATLTVRGELTPDSFHWLHDDTPALLPTATAAYEFTVAEDGFYEFLARYDASVSPAPHVDGWLFLFEGSLSAGTQLAQNNDYVAGDIPRLADLDGGCDGANCSGLTAQLAVGVTYTLVVTSAFNVPTDAGQPYGPFELTLSGPGILPPIPLPPALVLYASGIVGLAALRRRSGR